MKKFWEMRKMKCSKEGGRKETEAVGLLQLCCGLRGEWGAAGKLWEVIIFQCWEEDVRLCDCKGLLNLDITVWGDWSLRIPEKRHLDMMFSGQRRRLSIRRLDFSERGECRPFMESDWPWDDPDFSSN